MDATLGRKTVPRVVDLFSGAGGTGLGFANAGFNIVGAVERNPSAAETYERNLRVKVKRTDITSLDPLRYREELGLEVGELEVLVGCPPCQGFSRLRNSDGQYDDRNDLVLLYIEFVKEFRPLFALFENVSGITRSTHGRLFLQHLRNGLENLGYVLTIEEVDAANYGVPQHRKRIIVMAGRDGFRAPFPVPTHDTPDGLNVVSGLALPWLTVKDAIGNGKYPELRAGQRVDFPNHVAPKTGTRVIEFIMQVPPNGGSRADVPKEYWLKCHLDHKGHTDVYGRLSWERPAGTITSGCTNPSRGRFVHPDQDRALTPREAAALQGFPDTYEFLNRDIATQIGNAVPPPLAEALALSLKDALA